MAYSASVHVHINLRAAKRLHAPILGRERVAEDGEERIGREGILVVKGEGQGNGEATEGLVLAAAPP